MSEEKNPMRGIEIKIEDERLISIGKLADNVAKQMGLRCTPQMINNYEKHGLIRHSEKTKGGFRLYTIKDIHIVISIKLLQSEGLTLDQIKRKLEECPDELRIEETPIDLPEDRRTQILRASARVFPRKGYEATSLQEIAEEANISPSMIYQYFKSKEELFLTFTENMSFGQILIPIHSSLKQNQKVESYEDIHRTLTKLAIQFSRDHSANVEFFHMLMCCSRKFPQISKNYLIRFLVPMEELLEDYFDHLVEQGIFRNINTKHTVKIFFGIWTNIVLLRDHQFGKDLMVIPEEDEFGELVDIFLRSMLKNPP